MPRRLHRQYGAGHLHFITTSCYQRRPWLDSDRHRDMFVDVIDFRGTHPSQTAKGGSLKSDGDKARPARQQAGPRHREEGLLGVSGLVERLVAIK